MQTTEREAAMKVAIALALAGLIALVVALTTGSTWSAFGVVVLAAAGIVLLLRDWRADRTKPRDTTGAIPSVEAAETSDEPATALSADTFRPDISTDPDGPSSDARAD
jgi:hypothetical protein